MFNVKIAGDKLCQCQQRLNLAANHGGVLHQLSWQNCPTHHLSTRGGLNLENLLKAVYNYHKISNFILHKTFKNVKGQRHAILDLKVTNFLFQILIFMSVVWNFMRNNYFKLQLCRRHQISKQSGRQRRVGDTAEWVTLQSG